MPLWTVENHLDQKLSNPLVWDPELSNPIFFFPNSKFHIFNQFWISFQNINSFGPKIVQHTCIRSEICPTQFFFFQLQISYFIFLINLNFFKFQIYQNILKKIRGSPMWYTHELFWTGPMCLPVTCMHACIHKRISACPSHAYACIHKKFPLAHDMHACILTCLHP